VGHLGWGGAFFFIVTVLVLVLVRGVICYSGMLKVFCARVVVAR